MKEKVFILVHEAGFDDQIIVNVTPCRTEKRAKLLMSDEIKKLLKNGHYAYCLKEDLHIHEEKNSYYIKDTEENYYDYFKIEEKEFA